MKRQFPISLANGCKIEHLRKYMQKALDHMRSMRELGRYGDGDVSHPDFSRAPSLMKTYKSHRRSELIRLGVASEPVVRSSRLRCGE